MDYLGVPRRPLEYPGVHRRTPESMVNSNGALALALNFSYRRAYLTGANALRIPRSIPETLEYCGVPWSIPEYLDYLEYPGLRRITPEHPRMTPEDSGGPGVPGLLRAPRRSTERSSGVPESFPPRVQTNWTSRWHSIRGRQWSCHYSAGCVGQAVGASAQHFRKCAVEH